MMKRLVFSAAACLSVASLAHAQVPVLDNFGFENPLTGASSFNSFLYNPGGSSWVFNGLSGISGNNSGFTSGNPLAPEGIQVAFLQQSGSISQTFSVADNITNFNVSFLAAQRSTVVAQDSFQTFNVYIDTTAIGTFTPGSTNYAALSTSNIDLAAGTHTLTFTGLNPNGGDNTAFVDNVRLAGVKAIPEAGTVALLGTVLPLIGGVVVLRRKMRNN